jgi:hypothetical protein
MERRKSHDEESDLCFSPNVIRMGWARHATSVLCTHMMRSAYKMTARKPEGKRPLGDLGISKNILLKWVLNN